MLDLTNVDVVADITYHSSRVVIGAAVGTHDMHAAGHILFRESTIYIYEVYVQLQALHTMVTNTKYESSPYLRVRLQGGPASPMP